MLKFDFYTSYHQFYIADQNYSGSTEGDFWNDNAFKERMPFSDGIIAIATSAYGPIRGSFQIFDRAQEIDFNKSNDHIVECTLEIKSGKIQILDCPDTDVIHNFNVSNGFYNVRLYSSNLKIQDSEVGGDYHRIEVWPITEFKKRNVIKQYSA